MTINSGQVVRKPDITVDPNFFLPPNIAEVTYEFKEELGDDGPADVVDENGEAVASQEPFNTMASDGSFGTVADTILPAENRLPVPGRPTLISETARTTPGGNVVIDAILEIPDIPGITEVDVRISKIL